MSQNPEAVVATAFVFVDISDPLIAWLAYRGEMVSSRQVHDRALSVWHSRVLESITREADRAERYAREVAMERVRAQSFRSTTSRLQGFYAFPDEATARRASASWDGPFRDAALVEVGILEGSNVSRYDSEWITNSAGQEPDRWAHHYFSGVAEGQQPMWELVISGRAVIYGTELRTAAYEKVKSVWPRSLGLLELARIAVELRSDLGLCSAMIFGDNEGLWVDYVVDFQDADQPEFLERFRTYDGPKNRRDLNAATDLVVPDMRSRRFRIA